MYLMKGNWTLIQNTVLKSIPSDNLRWFRLLSLEHRACPARFHSKQDKVVPVRQDSNSHGVLSVTVRQDLIFEHNYTDYYITSQNLWPKIYFWLQLQTLDGSNSKRKPYPTLYSRCTWVFSLCHGTRKREEYHAFLSFYLAPPSSQLLLII